MSVAVGEGQRPLSGWAAVAFSVSVAGIVLCPYATMSMPAGPALVARGIATFLLALVPGVTGLLLGARPQLSRRAEWPLAAGVALYAACALGAGILGVLRGNEIVLVAGQVLSMGLLPLGAVSARCAGRGDYSRRLAMALAGATLLAALAHLGHLVWTTLRNDPVFQLYFPNNVSVVGPSLLALLCVAALRAAGGRRRSWAVPGALVLCAYIVGAGARSLWLVAPAACLVFAAGSGALARLLRPAALAKIVAAVLVVAAAVAAGFRYVERPRPNLLPDASFSGPFWRFPPGTSHVEGSTGGGTLAWAPRGDQALHVSDSFPVRGDRAYLLRASVDSASAGVGRIFLWWEGADGATACAVELVGPTGGWTDAAQAGISPVWAERAHLAVSARGGGEWRVRRISVEELGPPVMATLHRQSSFWLDRITSLRRLSPANWSREQSFRERFGESGRLLEQYGSGTVGEKLLGHGLGARFDFPSRWGDRPNYIHNFYLFLLYKTGIVGTVMVLAAMCLWIGFTFRAARRARDPWRRAFLWAAFSAWIGYSVWSLACPEILSPRMAPLWGFLIAATGDADLRERETEAGDSDRE